MRVHIQYVDFSVFIAQFEYFFGESLSLIIAFLLPFNFTARSKLLNKMFNYSFSHLHSLEVINCGYRRTVLIDL